MGFTKCCKNGSKKNTLVMVIFMKNIMIVKNLQMFWMIKSLSLVEELNIVEIISRRCNINFMGQKFR
jgi:hypothetical protein